MTAFSCLSNARPQLSHPKTTLPLRSLFTHPHPEHVSEACCSGTSTAPSASCPHARRTCRSGAGSAARSFPHGVVAAIPDCAHGIGPHPHAQAVREHGRASPGSTNMRSTAPSASDIGSRSASTVRRAPSRAAAITQRVHLAALRERREGPGVEGGGRRREGPLAALPADVGRHLTACLGFGMGITGARVPGA